MNAQVETHSMKYARTLGNRSLPEEISVEVLFEITGESTCTAYTNGKTTPIARYSVTNYAKREGYTCTFSQLDAEHFVGLINDESSNKEEEDSTRAENNFYKIFEKAVELEASDIHIVSAPNQHQIKFRIHGELEEIKIEGVIGQDLYRVARAVYRTMTGSSSSIRTGFRPELNQSATVKSITARNGK